MSYGDVRQGYAELGKVKVRLGEVGLCGVLYGIVCYGEVRNKDIVCSEKLNLI